MYFCSFLFFFFWGFLVYIMQICFGFKIFFFFLGKILNFNWYLPKHPETLEINRNDSKFFQSGIGTLWTKFLKSPLLTRKQFGILEVILLATQYKKSWWPTLSNSLNNSFQFVWKYVWMKKSKTTKSNLEIHNNKKQKQGQNRITTRYRKIWI